MTLSRCLPQEDALDPLNVSLPCPTRAVGVRRRFIPRTKLVQSGAARSGVIARIANKLIGSPAADQIVSFPGPPPAWSVHSPPRSRSSPSPLGETAVAGDCRSGGRLPGPPWRRLEPGRPRSHRFPRRLYVGQRCCDERSALSSPSPSSTLTSSPSELKSQSTSAPAGTHPGPTVDGTPGSDMRDARPSRDVKTTAFVSPGAAE